MRCARILGDGSQIIRKDMLNKCETPRGCVVFYIVCKESVSCVIKDAL